MDLDPREVVECGKVGPGEVLVVDTASRRGDPEPRRQARGGRPPALRPLGGALHGDAGARSRAGAAGATTGEALVRAQRAFGYGFEDLRLVLEPMGGTGADPVWSMGDDTPIPPLSAVPQSLYAYFRQRFAQVTNPPIDSLREAMVMSLRMHLGRRGSPLLERPSYARMLRLEHPVLLAGGDGRAPERRRLLDRHARRGVGRDRRASTGSGPRSPRSAARPSARPGAARTSSSISDRAADETPRADPDAARHRRGPPAPGAHRAPGAGRPRGRGGRRVRHPPLRHADRLRRRGGAPVAGARDPGRAVRRSAGAVAARARGARRRPGRSPAEARAAVPRGGGEGPAQDPVEDGHLDPLAPTAARRSSRCSAWATR